MMKQIDINKLMERVFKLREVLDSQPSQFDERIIRFELREEERNEQGRDIAVNALKGRTTNCVIDVFDLKDDHIVLFVIEKTKPFIAYCGREVRGLA